MIEFRWLNSVRSNIGSARGCTKRSCSNSSFPRRPHHPPARNQRHVGIHRAGDFKSWFVNFDPSHQDGRPRPEGMDEATAALFPDGFEESELGLVPRGWRVGKIGEVCTLGRGSSPRPIQNFMGEDIPWIKIADATASDGMFIFKTKEKIKREGASKSTAVAHGDLIMSNSASCGIPVFVELEGCIHDGWLYFKNFSAVSKILMFYWLRHISAHLVNIADGSVQKNLNIGLVSSTVDHLPRTPVAQCLRLAMPAAVRSDS